MPLRPPHTRVAITGMGVVTPIGSGVASFWSGLREGRSGVRHVRQARLARSPYGIAGEVDLVADPAVVQPRDERRFGRHVILGLVAATEALDGAGLAAAQREMADERIGIVLGTCDSSGPMHYRNAARIAAGDFDDAEPFYVVGAIASTAPAMVAKRHRLRGPSFSVSSACASGNHAIAVAAALIRSGQADVMLAGGTEGPIDVPALAGLGVMGALSRRTTDPEGACRPFDAMRDGFVLGEGAGVVVLESLTHARARGAAIHAELRGSGCTTDAHDLVRPHPDGEGALRAMRLALADAGLAPGDLHLVNAHGTSSPMGDLAEARALHALFGGQCPLPVHSTKSLVGHTLGAAGGLEAVAAVLAIAHGDVHPSLNLTTPDPAIDLDVVRAPRRLNAAHVLSNNFAFGGQNAVLVLSHPDA